jgi:cytochrome c oxidase subunit 2
MALPAGCAGPQSMFGGGGLQSDQFGRLFPFFLGVTAFFYALVILFLLGALFRRRREREAAAGAGGLSPDRLRSVLMAWVGLVFLGLTILTIASYLTDRATAAARPGNALEVEIVANQWWWDVHYLFPVSGGNVRTANELHLPVGLPVHVRLKSNDVIHSFWVPRLAGKQDLIPGRVNDLLLRARHTGQYRGQCAEFCGIQHAHMALDVTVETPARFTAWLNRQRAPAPPPATPLARAGYSYFMTRECSACHSIVGTPASGRVAPDLTHLASRRSIAAGTYPMTRGHLYAWVADPQGAKPGNNMPYIGLEPGELHAVVAYLETLQ